MILFFFLYVLIGTVFSTDENILCTATSCKDVVCPELSLKCKAQNATHNGVFVTSTTTCNCCQQCLDNLAMGDKCSTGDVSDPVPKEICGPGLSCTLKCANDTDGICSKMDTSCTQLQDDYDTRKSNGFLGTMEDRQVCDDEGDFVPYKCIPGQTCYCVDSKGNRIFGESDFTSLPDLELKCKCSRDYIDIQSVFGRELNPFEHFRCAANGDYETVQCIDDKCLCVDAYDGAPTYPNDPLVNATDISTSTLKCYKKKEAGMVLQKCEQEYYEPLEKYKSFKKDSYDLLLGFEFPKCDFDGTYQAVQENTTHKYCVDKEGTILTAVDKKTDEALAKSMDCNCIRALLVMTTNEKPVCQKNGNYKPQQCRRGKCRCVDSNGNQICKTNNCEVDEMEIDSLTCP